MVRQSLIIESTNPDNDTIIRTIVPITRATKRQLVEELQFLRNVWENLTSRNQDMSDDMLFDCTNDELRGKLEWYYSQEAKAIMLQHVIRGLVHIKNKRVFRERADEIINSQNDES